MRVTVKQVAFILQLHAMTIMPAQRIAAMRWKAASTRLLIAMIATSAQLTHVRMARVFTPQLFVMIAMFAHQIHASRSRVAYSRKLFAAMMIYVPPIIAMQLQDVSSRQLFVMI